jgi:LPXTG-motif cell wall-anchored protein
LKETKAPIGYVCNQTTWTVTVTVENDIATVKVSEDSENTEEPEETYYSNGIIQYLSVENTKSEDTVVIEKTFTGISGEDLKKIKDNSKEDGNDPYYITITENTEEGENEVTRLYLQNANDVSLDKRTFTWYITKNSGICTITEHNLSQNNYKDIAISTTVTSIDKYGTKKTGASPEINVNRDTSTSIIQSAKFTVNILAQYENEIQITNNYINTYQLQVKKVDASNQDAVLSGASFAVYGPFVESAAEVPNGVDKTIDYNGTKAYYIATIPSNTSEDNGIATMDGLGFSNNYYVKEIIAPEGYVLDANPKLVKVTSATDETTATGRYEDGIYTLLFPNTLQNTDTTAITVNKQWSDKESNGHETDSVKVYLYRKTADSTTAKLVFVNSAILSTTNNWQYTWKTVPVCDDNNNKYTYYIREQSVPGYNTIYSTTVQELTVGNNSKTVTVAPVTEITNDVNYSITITNSPGFRLPETGGAGSLGFYILGACFVLGSGLIGIYLEVQRKSQRKQ